jgi:hypothetical protein
MENNAICRLWGQPKHEDLNSNTFSIEELQQEQDSAGNLREYAFNIIYRENEIPTLRSI